MKDTNQITLRHIAGLYLDLYSTPRDLERPLTPEQVREAGQFFLDLLAAHEAEALIEKARHQQEATRIPGYLEIAELFAARYRREEGMDNDTELTDDDWYKASDVFLHYIRGC
jgi:hypothetical protein